MAERWAILVVVLPLAACVPVTTYHAYQAAPAEPWQRQVRYERADALLRRPPACVVVAPATPDSGDLGLAVESALARGLTQRVARVIQPLARDRLLRDLALDFADPRGRRWFAGATGCGVVLDWTLTLDERAYALVWAHRAIGVDAALREADGTLLWRARHDAWRGDGGLPLGPVGAVAAGAAAARLSADPELVDSMADDLARRLFATLPDLR